MRTLSTRRRFIRWAVVATGAAVLAFPSVAHVVANQDDLGTPGQHFKNADGSYAGLEQPDPNAPHAPKSASSASRPQGFSCPSEIGPLGAFQPAAEDFHYSDGQIVSGYRAQGSDGNVYELIGGATRPYDDRPVTAADMGKAHGFVIVRRYSGATVDACKALGDGSDRPTANVDVIPGSGSGPVTLSGVSGDVVSFRTSGGQNGRLNFVTQKFS